MNQPKTIALLSCYIGKLPWYFDYFVHSCRFNPSVDFCIISNDLNYSKPLPHNVKLVRKTLVEINVLAGEKLGFAVNISDGYKLCDFKPAYGLVFSDLLKGYDFWGHCDVDIIFGNIRSFMTDDLLEEYDLISVRPDWIPGCFLLFKNTPKMNTLFTYSKDYKKVFSSKVHYCFDETNFAHVAFEEGKTYHEITTEIESMMHVVKKMEESGYINPYFDLHIIEGIPGKLKWENGILTYRNKYEVLLYHLIRLKKNMLPRRTDHIPEIFTISPTKIYHKANSKITLNEF
jgi:hypothetical protein